jgi:hypothetical protein
MYVAYNDYGDLVATGDTYWELEDNLAEEGYDEWDVYVGYAGIG